MAGLFIDLRPIGIRLYLLYMKSKYLLDENALAMNVKENLGLSRSYKNELGVINWTPDSCECFDQY